MSLEALKEQVKSGNLCSLYLFYGPEEYLKKYYTDTIANMIVNKETRMFNYTVFEDKVEARKVIDACDTMPAFAERKLVVLKRCGLLKSKGKGEGTARRKDTSDDFVAYLDNLPGYTSLIIYEDEIDKRLKAVDTVKKKGMVVEFPYQKPADIMKWAAKVLRSKGKLIDQACASQLVEISEPGMNDILSQIDKLVLFTGDRTSITADDMEKVCTKSVKSRIFDLTDAVAARDSGNAFRLLDEMIKLKEPVQRILFMIARQFRLVLEMKLMMSNDTIPVQAASKLGVTPYAAGKLAKQAKSFEVELLKESLMYCLELDTAVKTGKINDRIAAELLITRFAQQNSGH